jgi:hypothetical protein
MKGVVSDRVASGLRHANSGHGGAAAALDAEQQEARQPSKGDNPEPISFPLMLPPAEIVP